MQPPQSIEEIKAGLETTEKGGVRIVQGGAFPVETDGLYDVLAVGQDVVGDCPGKHRVTLEYGQAVPYGFSQRKHSPDRYGHEVSASLSGGNLRAYQ